MIDSAWLLFGCRRGLRCRLRRLRWLRWLRWLRCVRPMPSVLHVADVWFRMPDDKLTKSVSH